MRMIEGSKSNDFQPLGGTAAAHRRGDRVSNRENEPVCQQEPRCVRVGNVLGTLHGSSHVFSNDGIRVDISGRDSADSVDLSNRHK